MSDKNDDNLKDQESSEETNLNQDSNHEVSGRGEFRQKQRSAKNIAGSLIWVVVILAIVSLAYYMTQEQDFEQTDKTPTTQVAKKSTSTSHKKASSKEKSTSTKKQATSTKTDKSSSKKKSSSSSEASSSSSSSEENATYVTVEAGQGLYRVAVNNGISVDKLMELNGLSNSSDIKPGQQLRVR